MTRIVAGALGGRRLTVPAGQGTRPTSDRVREALFSTLDHVADLDGARFADLYAGSGAVGLEACSRGAVHVLLAEADAKAARIARSNIAALGVGDRVRLVADKVERLLAGTPDEPYDVVFLDPPYAVADERVHEVLRALVERWLAGDAVVVVERSSRGAPMAWPEGLREHAERRYGETTLWYARRDPDG
ncbi:16S rRNA (guanine(966)-N(2))-methyltransferase RsmD [Dactylosporangium sp. AC04546]|uniref:16S rRNA (guanine(966)-N(2))-methyltransferase RsmD n=1 Tax=Dactylosporangium sp. AC04546 TaxID=2862460 RepID=UPI001EE093B3|nr:16S rRNA (guanine(966)-N(2))-methyltransferase RsmD [Dactylosporangium sp. AC04546]WVK85224.1 16S rRNA (guanine(966)-N(2))-methyltransferase RsmD [Dactylosporangium sp. AC04546]